MKIILSPAKKMRVCGDCFPAESLPRYLDRTEILYEKLKGMTEADLKSLFRANDSITHENYIRYREMNFADAQTPALLSYIGIQYQYMAPQIFSQAQWDYVKKHLRILSGFYGILKPGDRVVPYRLEMQAALAVDGSRNLYEFWGGLLYHGLWEDELEETGSRILLNLASKEYSKAIEPWLRPGDRYLTCVFGELRDGKVKVKATEAKMARGEMVRWLAEQQITDPKRIKEFSELSYRFEHTLSDDKQLVFLKCAGDSGTGKTEADKKR